MENFATYFATILAKSTHEIANLLYQETVQQGPYQLTHELNQALFDRTNGLMKVFIHRAALFTMHRNGVFKEKKRITAPTTATTTTPTTAIKKRKQPTLCDGIVFTHPTKGACLNDFELAWQSLENDAVE